MGVWSWSFKCGASMVLNGAMDERLIWAMVCGGIERLINYACVQPSAAWDMSDHVCICAAMCGAL